MSVSQSRGSFDSGGQIIGYDAFIPETGNGSRFPAVIGLHGSAGGHATMIDPAAMLAAQGFAVYVLHYFDRTGREITLEYILLAGEDTARKRLHVATDRGTDCAILLPREQYTDSGRIAEAGYQLTSDVNGYRQEGFAPFDRNIRRGRRVSAGCVGRDQPGRQRHVRGVGR